MKKNIKYLLLGVVALICIFFVLAPSTGTGSVMALMAFPFKQIGSFLRILSLSGFVGNITAIFLYTIICLLPLIFLIRKSKNYYLEDILLALISIALFFVVYLMINPTYISLAKGLTDALPITKAILGGTVYSIIIGYLILRAVRLFNNSNAKKLINYISILLYLLNIMFVAVICIDYFKSCIDSIIAMTQSNSGNESLFLINNIFIVLKFIANSLPYALNIVIVFTAIDLLNNLDASNAQKLSKICCGALIAVILSNIFINVSQLLLSDSLFDVNIAVQIPLFSIIFVLGCLLFAKIIKENAVLKAENDSFI